MGMTQSMAEHCTPTSTCYKNKKTMRKTHRDLIKFYGLGQEGYSDAFSFALHDFNFEIQVTTTRIFCYG